MAKNKAPRYLHNNEQKQNKRQNWTAQLSEDLDAQPFSLEEVVPDGGDTKLPEAKQTGQFSGEDLEFESFMFDVGDGKGIQQPEPAADVSANGLPEQAVITAEYALSGDAPMPGEEGAGMLPDDQIAVTGHELPMPTYMGDFVADGSVPSSPSQEMESQIANVGNWISSPLAPPMLLSPDLYPRTVAEWTDQMLASVEDFSAVLLAIRSATALEPFVPVVVDTDTIPAAEGITDISSDVSSVAETDEVTGVTAIAEAVTGTVSKRRSKPRVDHASKATSGPHPAQDMALPTEPVQDTVDAVYPSPDMELPQETAFESTQPVETYFTEPEHAIEPAESLGMDYMITADTADQPVDAAALSMAEMEGQSQHVDEPVPDMAAHTFDTPAELHQEAPGETLVEVAAEREHDTTLPPWLLEAVETSPETAQVVQETPTQEVPVAHEVTMETASQVLETPEMPVVEGDHQEVQHSAPATLSESDVAYITPFHMEMDEQPATTNVSAASDLPEVPEGKLRGDDLEFEPFMFDQGAVPSLPKLPHMNQFMPAVQNMESAVSDATFGTASSAQAELSPGVETLMSAGYAEAYPTESAPYTHSETPPETYTEAPVDARAEQASPAAEVEVEAQSASGDLPFWLQEETAKEAALNDAHLEIDEAQMSGPVEVSIASATEIEAPLHEFAPASPLEPVAQFETGAAVEAATETETPPEPDVTDNVDFAELPPIEPFDFSQVPMPAQEEELGISAEELISNKPARRDPMVTTADLDMVVGLLGREVTSGVLDPQSAAMAEAHLFGQTGQTGSLYGQLAESTEGENDSHSPGWTGMDTGSLSMETLSDLDEDLAPDDLSSSTTSGDEFALADFDIAPFDITGLGLDAEEPSTEFLNTTSLSQPYPSNPGKVMTETLFAKQPHAESSDFWETPEWMDTDASLASITNKRLSKNTDNETGHFADDPQDQVTASVDVDLSTQQLAAANTEQLQQSGATAALAGQADQTTEQRTDPTTGGLFKARVTRFKLDDWEISGEEAGAEFAAGPVAEAAKASISEEAGTPAATATSAVQSGPLDPTPTPTHQPTPSTSPVAGMGTSTGTETGYLSPIDGFHQLNELVSQKPTDLGARMALAVAYSQAGHLEHALHEYRRMVQKFQVPPSMLQMIVDQLGDLDNNARGLPRYHQLLGDIYMKQGHYQDAIEEYNKIT